MQTSIVGSLVSAVAREYSFLDGTTGKQVAGTTRSVWLVPAADQEPVAVKLRQDQLAEFHTLESVLETWPSVELLCDAVAQATRGGGARMELRLSSIVKIDGKQAKVA